MQYINGLKQFYAPEGTRTAATFGKFDGLHKGHQELIGRVASYADAGTKSVVCAFDMMGFLQERGIDAKNLMTKAERRMCLGDRVDVLIDCPFTNALCEMEAEDFIRDVLVRRMRVRVVVVGPDFTFGYEKRGDFRMLREYADAYGYEVEVVPKETYLGEEIGSTRIRDCLRRGALEDVNRMLGYPYPITGEVLHGRQIGRTIGIPTVNLIPEPTKLLPPNGVYASRVRIDGTAYDGITNIGTKPTVKDDRAIGVESYLFDYSGNAYEKEITVELYAYERPEQKFPSLDELKAQMSRDIEFGRRYFSH